METVPWELSGLPKPSTAVTIDRNHDSYIASRGTLASDGAFGLSVAPSRPATALVAPRPLGLEPRLILRAAILIQAAFRRWQFDLFIRLLQIRPAVPAPPVAVGLAFSRRRQKMSAKDYESEALVITAILCGHETHLRLGPLLAAFEEYSTILRSNHSVLELLKERFSEVARAAEDEVLAMMDGKHLPSEALQVVASTRSAWGAPAIGPPWAAQESLFPVAEAHIEGLRRVVLVNLTARLKFCPTRASLNALEAEVINEMGEDSFNSLRDRIRRNRQSHRDRVELELQASYGWPPKATARELCSAIRWFIVELGAGNLLVEDFSEQTRRVLKRTESVAEKALRPVAATMQDFRRRLALKPSPPKLLAEALRQELHDHGVQALELLKEWEDEIASESPSVLHLVCGIMGTEAFLEKCRSSAVESAEFLRTSDPNKPTEERNRLDAAARLFQTLQAIEAEGKSMTSFATEMRREFSSELHRVQGLMAIITPELGDPDDGWHRPPGFIYVEDRPVVDIAVETKKQKLEPEPPKMPLRRPDINVRMRLHGVTLKDAQAKSEILLLERMADIIATECGLPREWISDISFIQEEPTKYQEDLPEETLQETGTEALES